MSTTTAVRARFHLKVFLYGALLSLSGALWGHGADEPQHGGQVVMSGDVTFELVNQDNRIELFLLDDGVEMDIQGQTARIKLKGKSPAKFIDLKNGGGNLFYATDVTLEKGTKILVLVTKSDGYSKLGANFVIN